MSPDGLHAWTNEFANMFGNAPWVWAVIKVAFVVATLWATITAALDLWSKLKGPIDQCRALFYDAARRQRVVERQRFGALGRVGGPHRRV